MRVPTVASQMLGSIDGVCDDHDRALQLAVSQYLDDANYMCATAAPPPGPNLPRAATRVRVAARHQMRQPYNGEVLVALDPGIGAVVHVAAGRGQPNRNGVRLICHTAAGYRFAPPQNYDAENAIRKCWCGSRSVQPRRHRGTPLPGAADRDACTALFMNIPVNACGSSMDTSCSTDM